jgi:hypothetical protein
MFSQSPNTTQDASTTPPLSLLHAPTNPSSYTHTHGSEWIPAPDHNTTSSKLRIFLILFFSLPFPALQLKKKRKEKKNSNNKWYEDRPKKVSLQWNSMKQKGWVSNDHCIIRVSFLQRLYTLPTTCLGIKTRKTGKIKTNHIKTTMVG